MSKHLEELQRRCLEATRSMDDGRLFDDALTELFALHKRAGLDHKQLRLSISMECRHNGVELHLGIGRHGPGFTIGLMEPFMDISREELRKRWAKAFVGHPMRAELADEFGLTDEERLHAIHDDVHRRMQVQVGRVLEEAAANGNKIAYTGNGVQLLADALKRSLPEVKGLEFVGAEVIPGSPDAVSVSYRMPPVIEPITVTGVVRIDDPAPIPMSAQSFCGAIECVGELARGGCEASSQRIDDAASRNLISMDHAMRLMGSPQVVNNRREELLHIIGQDPWELGGFFNVVEEAPPEGMTPGQRADFNARIVGLAQDGAIHPTTAAKLMGIEPYDPEPAAPIHSPPVVNLVQVSLVKDPEPGCEIKREGMVPERWDDFVRRVPDHATRAVPPMTREFMGNPPPRCEIKREDPEQGERIQAIKDQWRGDR